jgi:hypothetical protein
MNSIIMIAKTTISNRDLFFGIENVPAPHKLPRRVKATIAGVVVHANSHGTAR